MVDVLVPDADAPSRRCWLLRPRRALSGRQFISLFLVLAAAVSAVAGYSAALGNVFAPLFAGLDLAIVGLALRHLWRGGERREWLWGDDDRLALCRSDGAAPVFSEHPLWVRLVNEGGAEAPQRLWLCSRGNNVEVGSFLAPDERLELLGHLRQFLAARRRLEHPSEVRSSA